MDEFIVLLVIAIVIIGVLIVFGGPLADLSEGNFPSSPGAGSKYREIASFDLGRVGLSDTEVSRLSDMGSFTLGQTQSDTIKEMPLLKVSRGYLNEDMKSFKINVNDALLKNIKDVKISFDVGESNLYGNLIIKWNDKIIFNRVANLNHYDIQIKPESVKTSNILEVSASTPGMYFWASTYYELKNFKVSGEYGPEKFMSFKIYPSDIESWSKGILRFYTTKGNGAELVVKLNGYEIYRKVNPEHLINLEFDYSDIGEKIKIGDNILTFKSDKPIYIDDVQFEVRLSTGKIVKEKEVNITSDDIALLGKGKGEITFTVNEIYKQGVLSIEINNRELNVQTLREGENSVGFGLDDVFEGLNTLRFSGTGSWDISNVKIGIKY